MVVNTVPPPPLRRAHRETHVCTKCHAYWVLDVPWMEEDIEVDHAIYQRCNGRVVQVDDTTVERFGKALAKVGISANDLIERMRQIALSG